MQSDHDVENYAVFLAGLDKDQLVRLALMNREQAMELRARYLRMRGTALHGTPEEVKNLSKTFEEQPNLVGEIPDDINYMRFVEQKLWK